MKVDMSPEAVKGRLKLVGRLWRLSVSLREAKRKTDARKKNENASKTHDREIAVS